MIVFAYGSNMSIHRIRQRTPSVQKIANVYVNGYRFAFNKFSTDDQSGKGNISMTENDQDIVRGVLFEINDNEIPALDRAEGGYHRIQVTGYVEGNNPFIVEAYVANANRINNSLRPLDWYKLFVVRGAIENNLPQDYINFIEQFEADIDENQERRQRNLDILNTG
jgi:gamma-glutamylcyclotransferase